MTYAELAGSLLAQGEGFLLSLFPAGKVRGREFVIGDVYGAPGDSLNVNMDTGEWYDFGAPEHKGKDYLSLYAGNKGLKNSDAFFAITGEHPTTGASNGAASKFVKPKPIPISPVPEEQRAWRPDNKIWRRYKPVAWWPYPNRRGQLLGYVARYHIDGEKEFTTWQYTADGWQAVGFEKPRPLLGLDLLEKRPNDPVLICEGEQACMAARDICGKTYVCVSWPNGAGAAHLADWPQLSGREVLIWPDNDEAGTKAAQVIVEALSASVTGLKLLQPDGVAPKWDAADALKEGMSWDTWKTWARPLVRQIYPAPMPDPEPEPERPIDSGSLTQMWLRLGLETSGRPPKPVCNLNNAVAVMEGMPDLYGRVWTDLFRRRMYINIGSEGVVEYQDHHTVKLLLYFQRKIGMQMMQKGPVYDGAVMAAQVHRKNPVQDFIDALPPWDGRARIRSFFRDCYGATKSEYNEQCSENFWKSLAARALEPGCQVDNMVVLEGEQGIKKTSSLRLLVGMDWYASAQQHIGSKEFKEAIQGKLLVEFSELATAKTAEVETIKMVITDRVDRFRVPWETFAQDHPRQCIFVGSVNPGANGYLKDETGNRRFWPVKCTKVDMDMIAKTKMQMWAEAIHRVRQGEMWWEVPKDEAEFEQAMRMQEDAWKEPIAVYLLDRSRTTVHELAERVLDLPLNKNDQVVMGRVCKILRILGWEKIGQRRHDGSVKVCWEPRDPIKKPPTGEG